MCSRFMTFYCRLYNTLLITKPQTLYIIHLFIFIHLFTIIYSFICLFFGPVVYLHPFILHNISDINSVFPPINHTAPTHSVPYMPLTLLHADASVIQCFPNTVYSYIWSPQRKSSPCTTVLKFSRVLKSIAWQAL